MGYADTHTQDILLQTFVHTFIHTFTGGYRDTDTTEDTRKDTRDTGTGYATYAHSHLPRADTDTWIRAGIHAILVRDTRYEIRDTRYER